MAGLTLLVVLLMISPGSPPRSLPLGMPLPQGRENPLAAARLPTERPSAPPGFSYTESTLGLLTNQLMPGNPPTIDVTSATSFAFDNVTNQIIVQGISDSSLAVINATTDKVVGGFVAAPASGFVFGGMAVDPSTGNIYVAAPPSSVVVADPRTDVILARIPVGSNPFMVAIDSTTHKAWVPNEGSNNVSVIDTLTFQVLANLPAGTQPETATAVPSLGKVFVGNWGSSNLSVFNSTTQAQVGTIPTGARPQPAVYDPDNRDLYAVSEWNGSITVVNATTDLVVKEIATGGFSLTSAAFDPRLDHVFTTEGSLLLILDGSTNTVLASAPVGLYLTSVTFDPVNRDVYVTDGTSPGTVGAYNGTTGLWEGGWNDTGTPEGSLFNPARGEMYISNQGVGTVSVMSSLNQSVLGTIVVSMSPKFATSGPADGSIFVNAGCEGGIGILNATTQNLSSCIAAPWGYADPMVYDPTTHLLYQSDEGSTVHVYNVTTRVQVSSFGVPNAYPWKLALDPLTDALFVYEVNWGNVTAFDLSTGLMIHQAFGASNAWFGDPCYDPVNRSMWITVGSVNGITYRYNATTYASLGFIGAGDGADSCTYDPLSHTMYVADGVANNVTVLNATTGAVVTILHVGSTPNDVAFDPNEGLMLVPSMMSNNLTVIDAATNSIITALPTGAWPYSVAFSQFGDFAAVPNFHAASVSVLKFQLAPGPSIESYATSPSVLPLGNRTILTASVWDNGGSATLSYGGLPPGCTSQNTTQLACLPTSIGNYTVLLNVSDNHGYTAQASLTIEVVSPLRSLATGAPTSGAAPLTVVFSSQVAGGLPPYRFRWDFGDGGSSFAPAPTHTYNVSGSYDAVLQVRDALGLSAWVHVWVNATSTPVSVRVSPSSSTIPILGGTTFTAVVSCTGGPCPSGTTYAWSLTNSIGGLNRTTGTVVGFTAGATAGLDTLFVNATANGITVQSAPVHITVQAILSGLTITPASATIWVGTSVVLTASPSCTGGPCPPRTSFAWTMTNALGSLNSSSRSVVLFTAGSAVGTDNLFVNATLNGYLAFAGPVPISIVTRPTPTYTVSFALHPTTCLLTFNGTTESSGSSGSYRPGTFNAAAGPCLGFTFLQWNVSGGVSVANAGAMTTLATVNGNGSLTAVYKWYVRPPPLYALQFTVSPASCGPITFNGTAQPNGSSGSYRPGTFNAVANSCLGFSFVKWNATGGVAVLYPTATSTSVVVSGNGSLNAEYARNVPPPPRYLLGFTVLPASCGPIVFNGTSFASGASQHFAASVYLAHAPSCGGGWVFDEWSFSPATLGQVQYYYTPWANISVTADGILTATYSPPPLSLSLSANASTDTVGAPATLTPTISGGVAPVTCLWSLNGTNTTQTGCSPAALTWSHPGNYTYRVWATDSASQVVGSNAVTVTVRALPVPAGPPPLVAFANYTWTGGAACSGSPESASFAGNARGGLPPYLFTWSFGDGGQPSPGRNVTHTYRSGPLTASLRVTDARGTRAWANLTLQIGAATCPLPPGPPGFSLFGLSAFASLALLAGLLAALVLAVVVLLFRRQRRKGEERGSWAPKGAPEAATSSARVSSGTPESSPGAEADPSQPPAPPDHP